MIVSGLYFLPVHGLAFQDRIFRPHSASISNEWRIQPLTKRRQRKTQAFHMLIILRAVPLGDTVQCSVTQLGAGSLPRISTNSGIPSGIMCRNAQLLRKGMINPHGNIPNNYVITVLHHKLLWMGYIRNEAQLWKWGITCQLKARFSFLWSCILLLSPGAC